MLKFIKTHWDKIILAILICLYIATLANLSVLRHNAFASNFDLSNMDHTLWNTLHGRFFSFRLHDEYISRLAIHADFILILLSPLYLLWNDVRALIISESIFLALGAIPVYLLAFKLLQNKIVSLVITFVYLLNPGMQWTDLYDFHGVSLAIPFFLFAFYFAYIKKWRWYGVFILLALLTKENVSLSIAMLGLAVLFVFKNRWIGLTTFLIGIIWFFTMVYAIMPHFSPDARHWAFEGLGDGSANPLPSIIKSNMDIATFTQTFFNQKTLDYYILLLKPFAFIPLLGLPWLLLSAPEFAINILRGMTIIHFHYDSVITPSLVIAIIFGFYYIKLLLHKFHTTKKYTHIGLYLLAGFLLAVAIRVNYNHSPLPTTPSCWCFIYNVTEEDAAFEKALQSIPKDASVTASIEIRPHINHRREIYFVPSATKSAQFIALITQNRTLRDYEPKLYENELIPILLSSKELRIRFKSKHFYLFERVAKNKEEL